MNMINDVAAFMRAGEQENTPEQVEKQIGFALEETEEMLCATGFENLKTIRLLSEFFKEGRMTQHVLDSDKTELLDAFLDIAWVAIGGAIAMGADVEGAWAEVVRSNMSKVDPATGKMVKDENGKIIKPPNFSKPELAKFLPNGGK